MEKWIDIFKKIAAENKYIKINPPATQADILKVEAKTGNKLPEDLKNMLLEINGDDFFVFSTDQIIETNLSVRKLDFYMPLDCLLFFAGNGCGDYFGFPITREDGVRSDRVFVLEHESDDRIWKATSLLETVTKYYNDEL